VVLTGANDIAEEKPAHLEGWLEKKGHGHMVGGEWQKRYFSLPVFLFASSLFLLIRYFRINATAGTLVYCKTSE
jgi:hypothetical protein